MAKKKQPTQNGFVLFDVIYQDGARSSNRSTSTCAPGCSRSIWSSARSSTAPIR